MLHLSQFLNSEVLYSLGSEDPVEGSGEKQNKEVKLVDASFNRMRALLGRKVISTIWYTVADSDDRAFRPDPAEEHGRGMNYIYDTFGVWLSSRRNTVALPFAVDPTFLSYMGDDRLGVLGDYESINSFDQLGTLSQRTGFQVYSIDHLDPTLDGYVVNGSSFTSWANTKMNLKHLSGFAVPYEDIDARQATAEDYKRLADSDGVVFMKLNNTEVGRYATTVARDKGQFLSFMNNVVEAMKADSYINPVVSVQTPVWGDNFSVEFFITPEEPDKVFFMGQNKKFTQKGAVETERPTMRLPVKADEVDSQIKEAILDCRNKIKARREDAFGFVTVEFIKKRNGEVNVYDIRFRPTTGTHLTMATKFVEGQLDPGIELYSCPVLLERSTNSRPRLFSDFIRPLDERGYTTAQNLEDNGFVVLPLSYNQLRGVGIFTVVSNNRVKIFRTLDELKSITRTFS